MVAEPRWLLLVHQIPPKPDYLRVKVGRRLARIGSVALKKSVYVLPLTDGAREDLDWVRREIAAGGGDAFLIEAAVVAGVSDAEVEDSFRTARDADYEALAGEAREIAAGSDEDELDDDARRRLTTEVVRLERRLDEIETIDFFGAASHEPTRALVATLRARASRAKDADDDPAPRASPPRGGTWVTRTGVHVDRIASAWLVRRFIDPDARFKFVPARGYRPEPGELRFDMDDAEYTHEGDRCTFEVLCERFALRSRGLAALGEIIHDIDLKDGRYARPQTAGVAALISGIALLHREDETRLRIGFELLDALLAALGKASKSR